MAYLVLVQPIAGLCYPLAKGRPFRIGRGPDCELTLPDAHISRHHATLENTSDAAGERYQVIDSSRNGTRVNGKNVRRCPLQWGDLLEIGRFAWRLCDEQQNQQGSAHSSTEPIHPQRMIGTSAAWQSLLAQARLMATTDLPVLIQGESGTGKDLLAHFLHSCSSRLRAPLVTLNCTALPSTLIESELFGHERGAFTNAHTQRKGLFEAAHKGSLFLDEIGDLPLETQPKLLRALEDGAIRPVGANTLKAVDTRIIAATHRNLDHEIDQGRFRLDLYHRLSVLILHVPPLRQRLEDLQALIAHFLTQSRLGALAIEPTALELLQTYPWPGNLRELRNVILRCALERPGILNRETLVRHLPKNALDPVNAVATPLLHSLPDLDASERHTIERHLNQFHGNRSRTAASLGISRSTLLIKLRKYGLAGLRF